MSANLHTYQVRWLVAGVAVAGCVWGIACNSDSGTGAAASSSTECICDAITSTPSSSTSTTSTSSSTGTTIIPSSSSSSSSSASSSSSSSSSSDATDAGPPGDASTCVTIDASDYGQSCQQNTDCVAVWTGTVCGGECFCANAAISASAKDAYDAVFTQHNLAVRTLNNCNCPSIEAHCEDAGVCALPPDLDQ
ncbi:MAG: hypothetical protein FWD17_19335 [Polyangiaceae bacterium]|nr:hypothetical protein [Polyangiaceae bacterium]